MRVQVSPQRVELLEGVPLTVTITVSNTTEVIGGYSLRVLGADPSWVQLSADSLSLFPDTSETVLATVTVPKALGAGDRRIAIQVRELTPPGAISVSEIDLVVPPHEAIRLALSPMTVICGRNGRFGVVLDNIGNTVAAVAPIGIDPEEKIEFTFDPPLVTLAPGEHSITDLRASARRRWFGSPVVRTFSLALPPLDPAPIEPGAPIPAPVPVEPLATGSMLQKPIFGRAALSLLSLLVAVSVFAVVITIALSKLVSVSASDRNLALQVAAARQSGSGQGSSSVGGQVKLLAATGAVSAVTVEIFSATALGSPLTSTATDAAGKWKVPNLPAGSYKLRFRGAGFNELWYPGAADGTDAGIVELQDGQQLNNLGVVLGGLPGTISGIIVGADVAGAVLTLSVPLQELPRDGSPPTTLTKGAAPTTLSVLTGAPVGTSAAAPTTSAPASTGTASTAVPAGGGVVTGDPGATVRNIPIGSDGTFQLEDVASPAIYNLTVAKGGFATATQTIDLAAGEDRTGVQIRLRTGDGVISGTIRGPGNKPLGGALITATTGKTTVSTVSLTNESQAVGTYSLRGLVTPGTYTLTVTKDGFISQSSSVVLAARQILTKQDFTITASAGSLSGTVRVLPGNALASGVSVTVSTGSTTVSTVTQSGANVGSWTIDRLDIPGTYTLTFSRSDLQSQTVSVSLDAQGRTVSSAGNTVDVSLKSATAVVTGTVTQRRPGGTSSNVGEAVISLSSGSDTYTVTSASLPSNQLGRYEIAGVKPGTYTLSASRRGTSPTTVIVTVEAGQILNFDPVMIPPASILGTVSDRGGATVLGLQVLLYQSAQYPAQVYRSTTTDAQGKYEFPDVDAPQAYVLEIRSPTAGPLGSETFVVAASEEKRLPIKVGIAAAASGVQATGTSIAGTSVTTSVTTSATTPAGAVVPGTATSTTGAVCTPDPAVGKTCP